MWEQKECVAPARGRGTQPGSQAEKVGLRKGICMAKERNPRAEGLRAGQWLCDNRPAPAGHGMPILMLTDVFPLTSKLDLEQGKSW